MAEITLKEHLAKIQSKGGKALVKKRGTEHMRTIINKRWAKHRKDKLHGKD